MFQNLKNALNTWSIIKAYFLYMYFFQAMGMVDEYNFSNNQKEKDNQKDKKKEKCVKPADIPRQKEIFKQQEGVYMYSNTDTHHIPRPISCIGGSGSKRPNTSPFTPSPDPYSLGMPVICVWTPKVHKKTKGPTKMGQAPPEKGILTAKTKHRIANKPAENRPVRNRPGTGLSQSSFGHRMTPQPGKGRCGSSKSCPGRIQSVQQGRGRGRGQQRQPRQGDAVILPSIKERLPAKPAWVS